MKNHTQRTVPLVPPPPNRRCLSCGAALPSRRRRYCSAECPQHLLGSLNRRSGLLRALNARYATFYFTPFAILMDVLLYDTAYIHSYMLPRLTGRKPVEDFCRLSNLLGTLWWSERGRTRKRYLATQKVLERARRNNAPVNSVMPAVLTIPSVKARHVVQLELDAGDLSPVNLEVKIKSAFRRQAMKHHPDLGGSRETFIKIQEAYEKLTQWARKPTFRHQRSFPDKWLYQGATHRWSKPLQPRKKSRTGGR